MNAAEKDYLLAINPIQIPSAFELKNFFTIYLPDIPK
jgi:hypothetical protein